MRAKAGGAATGRAGECRCGVQEGGREGRAEGSWREGGAGDAVIAAATVGVVEGGAEEV